MADFDQAIADAKAAVGRITWWAVGQHAAIGFAATLLLGLLWRPMVYLTPFLAGAVGVAREVYTAKWRHKTTLAAALGIVLRGEGGGWSRYNLIMQGLAPLVGGLLLTLIVVVFA